MKKQKSLYHRAREVAEEKTPNSEHKALAALLRPLSLLYRAGVLLRIFLYNRSLLKKRRLPVPVISVGNITAGGTGKTPVVAMITTLLKAKGKRPVILSRGYKGTATGAVNIVSNGEKICLSSTAAGDEPFLLANKLPEIPVLTGSDRYTTGQYAISKFGAEALILDDGFQHVRLKRDLDILLVDSTNPFGNTFMLPRGVLREPVSAMERAHMIVLTKCEKEGGTIFPFQTEKPVCAAGITVTEIVEQRTGTVYKTDHLRSKRVFAFCGIGAPDSFYCSLTTTGCEVAGFKNFPDHHGYTVGDSELLGKEALKQRATAIVTTEKDAVRIPTDHQFPLPVFFLKIEIQMIIGKETLENRINALFQ